MTKSDKQYESIARQLGAANLLALRTSTGMSQPQFAATIGLSDRALRRYERGERELPLVTRIAIIQAFKIDPLASNQIAAELGFSDTDISPGTQSRTANDEGFWKTMRRESQDLRKRHYSALGQILLKIRDYTFAGATMYLAVENIAWAFGLPFGFEINGIDWMFVGSFILIVVLFSSVVTDLPLLKAAQHVFRNIKAHGTS
ncbi:helix-turn-helix domain-containing protein [Paracoccus sp. JM45]|uniref:helix-turn-helix domain-containing protein n=1 Tax=Paracoccus sp. JM45 TaxID=2283626 RepID=UPI0011C40BD4|nr:helix-turn-helix transcriptional regulator [Paracoccus sp. JM45]